MTCHSDYLSHLRFAVPVSIAGLLDVGLAAAKCESLEAGGKMIKVARITTTDSGWRSLCAPAPAPKVTRFVLPFRQREPRGRADRN